MVKNADIKLSSVTSRRNRLDKDEILFSVFLVEYLAAKKPDIFPRIGWRPNQSFKEGEYWTYVHQVARNKT